MAKPKSAQSKLTPVSFRLEPKVKYAAEIMARQHRRSLASTVEWALLRSLEGLASPSDEGTALVTLQELVNTTWSEDDLIRSVNVAFLAPHLATHEESCIKTVIIASPPLFMGPQDGVHELERVNLGALLVVRHLVYERAHDLSVSGALTPITDEEWAAAYQQSKAGGKAATTKDEEDKETLRLKLEKAEEYISLMQAYVRSLKTQVEESKESMVKGSSTVGSFQVVQDKQGRYFCRFVDSNGKLLLSDHFEAKAKASAWIEEMLIKDEAGEL